MRTAAVCLAAALLLTLLSVLLSALACELDVVDRPRSRWDEPFRLGPVSRSMRDVENDYELRQDYGFPFACIGYQRHYGWRPMSLLELRIIERSMNPLEYVRTRYFSSEPAPKAGASAEDQAFAEMVAAVAKEERARMRWRCSWLGLGANIVAYSMMLGGAFAGVRLVRRWRMPKNACRRCRYPCEGLPTAVCPECGEPRS